MTAFGASLFAFAALASAWTIIAAMLRYGPAALTLKAQLANCPATLLVTWKMVERVQVPALASLRKRPVRRVPARLEWPGSTLDLAA